MAVLPECSDQRCSSTRTCNSCRGEVRGRVVAGAVLSTGSAAVGLSNVFTDNLDATGSWAGCLALVNALLPGIPVVGYETGAPLIAALANGFESPGALRVWLRDI